jgi:WD40 repeat protein
MASASTKAAAKKPVLTPTITLKGHRGWIRSISDFPDGQRMISGSDDKTARQWDLKAGKEIGDAQSICEECVYTVAVSRDGRYVVTGGGRGELKVCEVGTGIVRTFEGHSQAINCVDISADNTLLVSGASDETVRIWNLDTGKLVAGPFDCKDRVGAVRFSADQKKLAVKLATGKSLQVWGIQSQKLDAKVGDYAGPIFTHSSVFWTNNDETIVAALNFTKDDYYIKTIYELDGSTLETIEPPFEGHTTYVNGLALSSDNALLASTSDDHTIKLWAFASRQLLASFDVQNIYQLILSPNSRQLTYMINNKDVNKICICETPADVLAQARVCIPRKHILFVCLHSLTGHCTQKVTPQSVTACAYLI